MATGRQGESDGGRADGTNERISQGSYAMRLNRHQRRATKTDGRRPLFRPRLLRLEDKLAPAVFWVTNTNDGGAGSLDEAIFLAENTPNAGGPDEVRFDIDGAGVHTIHPSQAFPVIADPLIIDGYTQGQSTPGDP